MNQIQNYGINGVQKIQPKQVFEAKSNITEPKKENNTKKVVLAGLGALATLGLAAIAIKNARLSQVFKDVNINEFKAAGNKFVNGKAVAANGEMYTGTVTTTAQNGKKHVLTYENGVLKESRALKETKIFDGSVKDMVTGKKVYNYDEAGKLKSVDNYTWGHVSTRDPKAHGFQFIKTGSTDIAQKQADGLANHAKKQAEAAAKQAEVAAKEAEAALRAQEKAEEEMLQKIQERSAKRKAEISAKKQQEIKETIKQTEEKLSQKRTVNAETIDASFNNYQTSNAELDKLKGYYTDMETASSKKAAADKLKAENPAEYKRLQAEKKAQRKAESLARRTTTETLEDGNIRVITEGKNGTKTVKIYAPDGKTLIKDIQYRNIQQYNGEFYASPGITEVKDNGITRISTTRDIGLGGGYTERIKVKGADGKYVERQRSSIASGYVKRPEADYYNDSMIELKNKSVYHLNNGKSLTVLNGSKGEKIQILRDSKGNVLKETYKPAKPENSASLPPDLQDVKIVIVPQKPKMVKLGNGKLVTLQEYEEMLRLYPTSFSEAEVQFVYS